MRLLILFLLAGFVHVSAGTHAQTVTFSGKNLPMLEVLNAIRTQGGYEVAADRVLLRRAKPVSITAKDMPVEDFIRLALQGQELDYTIEEQTIVIKEKVATPVPTRHPETGARVSRVPNEHLILAIPTVTGRITDTLGQPLAGASVVVLSPEGKRTSLQTTTKANGIFVLENVPEGAMLRISFMGYVEQEIPVKPQLGTIRLKPSESPLDEVQVMAYGTTSRRLSTGNIGTIKADVIEKQAGITNPLLALQGRIPGLVVTQNTGMPGGGITVRIQGQNSIDNGNTPLYVVDGVPIESFLKPVAGSSLLGNSGTEQVNSAGNNQGNPLSYLNPTDIESIDVLKDADATAIYGSQAANGAILITTKKGKPGKMQLTADVNTGWGSALESDFRMMNTREYLDMRYEAFRNDGIDWRDLQVDAPDLKLWDTTRYTDWRKELMSGTALTQRMQASVLGGSNSVQYRLSGTYSKTGSIFPDAGNGNPIASISSNISSGSADQRLSLNWSTNYQYNHQEMPGGSRFVQAAWLLPPHAPTPFLPDGTLNWAPDANGNSTYLLNPYINMTQLSTNTTTNLISNLRLGYTVFRGLNVSTSLGYSNIVTNTFMPSPTSAIQPEFRANTHNQAQYGDRTGRGWVVEPQLAYQSNSRFGKIDMLLGGTFRESENWVENMVGSNYATDALLDNVSIAAAVSVENSGYSQYKYLGYFGRLNYNLADEFILNVSARRDGSSRFGPNKRFNNFWSLGGAWIWSQQDFIKEKLTWLSFGKLTASYGITGNDGIGDFRYIRNYFSYSLQVPYAGVAAMQANGLPNPDLVWERVNKFSAGVNLGFLKDRMLFNFGYAQNHSDDQLMTGYGVSSVTGSGNMSRNLSGVKMRNSTWEFSLNTINIRGKDVEWSTNFNFSVARNKLVSWPDLETSSYRFRYTVGEPVDRITLGRFGGVNAATGEYQLLDKSGNPTNAALTLEDIIIRSSTSPFYGGLQNAVRWKGLSLDFFIQFTERRGTDFSYYNGLNLITPGVFTINGGGNQPAAGVNRWSQPGDQAKMGKVSTNVSENAARISATDAGFRNISFARLKNASLSWQVPASWITKAGLQSARLTTSGQNLFTWTSYEGPDPETDGLVAVPPLRVFNFGVQLVF